MTKQDWSYKRRVEQHRRNLDQIKRGEYLLLGCAVLVILFCMLGMQYKP